MRKLNILKIIDQWGWAYHFTGIEQQRYTKHNITFKRIKDFDDNNFKCLNNIDIVYFPSPDISSGRVRNLIPEIRKRNIKIIGGFSGGELIRDYTRYLDVDLILTINIQNYANLVEAYPDKTVIFLPECIDTNFFKSFTNQKNYDGFIIGFAGNKTSKAKRHHLLKQLIVPITQKTDSDKKFLKENRTLYPMIDFYNSLTTYIQLGCREASPRSVMEAMAMSLPVISTCSGSVPLMLDKEWTVPEYPENLIVKLANEKLKLLKENKELREKIGKRNRELVVKYFSWEKNQILWDEVWEALMKKDYSRIKQIHTNYLNKVNKPNINKVKWEELIYNKNANKYLKELNNLFYFFKKMNFQLFLSYGSLLGAIRKKDFIKNDNDIDITYISKQNNLKSVIDEFEFKLRPYLEKQGYKIETIKWGFSRKKKRLCLGQFHLIRNGICLDLWSCWIDKKDKVYMSMSIAGEIMKGDLLPLRKARLRNKKYNVPNNPAVFFKFWYGENWKTPSSIHPKPNHFFYKRHIIKIIDEFGWAYYFVAKEQQKYTFHNLEYQKIEEYDLSNNPDLIYIHSPAMWGKVTTHSLPLIAKSKEIVVIGGYASTTKHKYDYVDLIVTVSPKRKKELKQMYPNKEVIFLPESVDTNFFLPLENKNYKNFVVGYAGRLGKVKRTYLFDKLNSPIKIQCEHEKKNFVDGRSQEPMVNFYNSIDCLILLSSGEAMSKVTLEAMSCGLPVISTDVGSARMILGKEWVIPTNPEDTVIEEANKKLTLLKKYPKLRKSVGERNRKFIDKYFSWKNNQQLWDRIFSILVDEHYPLEERIKKAKIIEQEFIQFFENSSHIKFDYVVPIKKKEFLAVKKFIKFLPLKDKKVILYSRTPMQGKMWEYYKTLKKQGIDVNLIQNTNKYSGSKTFPCQYLLPQDNEICKKLVKESDIVIFVQYYNKEMIELAKNKEKIGLFIGDFAIKGDSQLESYMNFLFTTRKNIYPYATEIKDIKDLI